MIIYNFFKNLILNIKYSRILKKIYKEENLLQNLTALFGVSFRIDRIGRVYAVINPFIVNGKYDPNTVVYEYGEQGLGTNEYVERIIMERLNAAEKFLHANNLFELLTYKITKLDDDGNFLFVFQPITLEDCLKYSKYFVILIGTIGIVALTLCLTFFNK